MDNINNKILVVDDIQDIREGLSTILTKEGYEVSIARNGIQALEKMKDSDINLMVTDILMPDMDGLELVTKVKTDYPLTKIILISGGGRKEDITSEYNMLTVTSNLTGEKNILKKPFKPQAMLDMVKTQLAN